MRAFLVLVSLFTIGLAVVITPTEGDRPTPSRDGFPHRMVGGGTR